MKKHIRTIITALRQSDISAEVIPGNGHIQILICKPDEPKRLLVVASTPRSTDATIDRAIKQAKKIAALPSGMNRQVAGIRA